MPNTHSIVLACTLTTYNSEQVIDHWQRKLVKAREAFEQSCGCPWGSKLERIGLLSTLDERLGVYSNEARDEENLFKLSEIEDPGLREKAQLLFKEKIEFKIDPNSLKELDKVWSEELQSFIKLFKEKEKKMEVREMTTAYDGLQTCISSKLNPTVGKFFSRRFCLVGFSILQQLMSWQYFSPILYTISFHTSNCDFLFQSRTFVQLEM